MSDEEGEEEGEDGGGEDGAAADHPVGPKAVLHHSQHSGREQHQDVWLQGGSFEFRKLSPSAIQVEVFHKYPQIRNQLYGVWGMIF